MRTALALTMLGLVIEAFCLYELTPGTFLIFALVAVPLNAAALLLFVVAVWRNLRRGEGL